MKILIADQDRDFLSSFQKLFELYGDEVTTAFDGTQVIYKTAQQHFDIVVLSYEIPRVTYRELIKLMNENNMPVIMLMRSRLNSDILLDDVLANAHIRFPFFPEELSGLVRDVVDKSRSDEKISLADTEIDIKKFMLGGKIRITNEEINTIKQLQSGVLEKAGRAGIYINSLNNKLSAAGSKISIRYRMKEGFRMVTDNE